MLKARFHQYAGIHVVFEVVVVEGKAETVQTLGREEFGIGLGEEVGEELVEEEVVLFLAEDFEH